MKTFTQMAEEQQEQKKKPSSKPARKSKASPKKKAVSAEIVPIHRAGSPTKLTPEVHQSIVELISTGKPLLVACGLTRVSKSSVYSWLQKGEDDPDGPCGQFALDVAEAQAMFKAKILDTWYELGMETKQWTAMATLLERLFPEEFKRPSEKQSVTVNVGILEQRVHEMTATGELVYDGG